MSDVDESRLKIVDWHRAHGSVAGTATFRQELADFVVEETLRFEPSGEGAHHLLYIEKKNVNTDQVAQKLKRFAEVKPLDVGYAGKKDRYAIARQWFSVQLPMLREIDWSEFDDDETLILQATRHDKKVRIGAVKSNQFTIRLREVDGDKSLVESKLNAIENVGFPNYFGEQRFGYNGDNITRGADLLLSNKRLKNRSLQGLLLSSVRSFLFNQVLSRRIELGHFSELLSGDYAQLDGSESGFLVEDLEQELLRFNDKDLHPTAPLAGDGDLKTTEHVLEFECETLQPYADIIKALSNKRMSVERRAIRVFPKNVEFTWHDSDLELSFSLPKGAFATSMLRELVELKTTEY